MVERLSFSFSFTLVTLGQVQLRLWWFFFKFFVQGRTFVCTDQLLEGRFSFWLCENDCLGQGFVCTRWMVHSKSLMCPFRPFPLLTNFGVSYKDWAVSRLFSYTFLFLFDSVLLWFSIFRIPAPTHSFYHRFSCTLEDFDVQLPFCSTQTSLCRSSTTLE